MHSKAQTDAGEIADGVTSFLMRNFPQIAMHGGNAAVESVDEETGEVWLRLGGACSGGRRRHRDPRRRRVRRGPRVPGP